ncbi:MAG: YigZ family protein [Saprospiraceae bacterium]|nr:YigZ family protein [Saprospiraceae bacterium]
MHFQHFRSILNPVECLYKEKASKFYGFAFPLVDLEDWQLKLNQVRSSHSKATHHCYAFRCGQYGESYRTNDDGEPSGSAGRPILGQIDSLSLNHVLVIVVRYFGGTKLGVPGLIHAYKETARLTLEGATIVVRYYKHSGVITLPYLLVPDLMNLGKEFHWELTEQSYEEDHQVIKFSVRSEDWERFERDVHVKIGGIYPDNWDQGDRSNLFIINLISKNV